MMKHVGHANRQDGRDAGQGARGIGGKVSMTALFVVLAIGCLVLVAVLFIVIGRPSFAEPVLSAIGMQSSAQASAASESKAGSFGNVGDAAPTESQEAAARKNPYIAKCGSLLLNSPISPVDLTGVLFHQASNNYAIKLDTELPEADYEKVSAERSMRINNEQTSSEWLDAEALHLWRTSDQTEMETCIDVGAPAGSTVRAPVTGTVILVRTYMLEGTVEDYEIHIQPDGYPDYDCVLIHVTDPKVKAGDRVEAGITELSKVRDIEKDLTDVQLSFFTPEGVGGNHTHLQVNDASYPGYRTERIPEALKVKS